MSELKQKLLLHELSLLGFRDAIYIHSSDKIKVQSDNDRMPFINDEGDISYGSEYDSLAVKMLRPIVDGVNEVVAAWEQSKPVPVDDVSRFRMLAEYNNVILAARDDTNSKRGLHYVTWRYDTARNGVSHGHYTDDYFTAKEDFALRSGLVLESKIFTKEQAEELIQSVRYRIDNDNEITFVKEEMLTEIADRLRDAYPSKESGEKGLDSAYKPPDKSERASTKPKTLANKLQAGKEKAEAYKAKNPPTSTKNNNKEID